MPRRRTLLAAVGTALVAGCTDDGASPTPGSAAPMTVRSVAFEADASIPVRYTADGENVSPPLSISGVPDGAASLALVVDDPDAPNPPFTHWLCWAIPPETTSIPEGIPATERVATLGDAVQGRNDLGGLGYAGPAPPSADDAHRYRFTVSALEEPLGLEPGADRGAVDDAMAGLALARGRLVGTYDS